MNLGISKVSNWFSSCHVSKFFKREHCKHDLPVALVAGKIAVLFWFLFLLSSSFTTFSQTILVDPAGDGGFENGTTFTANGWTEVNDNRNYWVIGTTTYYAGNRSGYISRNGTNNLYRNNRTQTSHFHRDITVPAGESTISLSFYLKGIGEADWDRLLVYTAPVSVTPTTGVPNSNSTTLSGATLIYTQPNTISNYILETIDLDPSFAGTTFRLIFTWQNDDNTGANPPVSVDNISVTSSCIEADFSASATTIITGGSIDFTDNSTDNPTSWLWTFTGGTPASSTVQNPTGIIYNTVGTYEVSLTATNAAGCSNTKTNYITVQDYCSASSTAPELFESITNVTFAGINNSSPAIKTVGYTDYTSSVSSGIVVLGNNYAISITDEFIEDEYPGYCKVYLDYNKDGDFDDAGELVFESAYSGNSIMAGTVSVPASANLGLTRMRIVIEGDADNTGALACGNFTWGEVEDYSINITSTCTDPDIPTLTASSNPICSGDNVTLTITGNLNDAALWHIYTGSCGGTQIGTTATSSFVVNNITTTTTYFVRGEGNCVTPGSCRNVTVTVEDTEDPTITCATPAPAYSNDGGECYYTVPDNSLNPTATGDNCVVASVINDFNSTNTLNGAQFPVGTTTVIWTVADAAGNTATCQYDVIVNDDEDPTITCPANISTNPDAGLCTYSGGIGTPVTSDNCLGESANNDAPATFPMGNTIVIWTVTDAAGNTATCNQTVTVQPAQIIDIEVDDLGNSCQSGETGSTTTITWDITKNVGSTDDWTYNYAINDGSGNVDSGTNVNANDEIQISYTMNNATATDKTYTITITNVKDNCGVAETNTGNNSDSVTLFGVPQIGSFN